MHPIYTPGIKLICTIFMGRFFWYNHKMIRQQNDLFSRDFYFSLSLDAIDQDKFIGTLFPRSKMIIGIWIIPYIGYIERFGNNMGFQLLLYTFGKNYHLLPHEPFF